MSSIGGSGGASNCTTSNGQAVSSCSGGYAKPSWQTGAGVPSDGKRDIPDVSLFASNGFVGNFYIICEADQNTDGQSCNLNSPFFDFAGVGGTSASAPSFAGIMALVNQKTQARQGNANFVLYKLAAKPGASCTSAANPLSTCTFYDVPTGSTIAMPCFTGSLNCTTSVMGDQFGVLSGFSTTSGYDLATGLGSVNAANLVNNWSSVTFTPSTTTLGLNPVTNIAHGTAVNVNITVAPKSGAGTPTGQASLLTSTGLGVTDFTLNNGSISTTTHLLPGRSYTVTAHYGGDGTFGASDSTPPTAVTVTPEASATAVKALTADVNGNPIPFSTGPYGSFVFLRADVTGISGNGTPTGNVNFTDNAANITGDPYALNSEGNTVTPLGLFTFVPGPHSIAASYSGDASFNASSTTAPAAFTITQAPTSSSVNAMPTAANLDGSVTLNATISTNSGFNPITGTFGGANSPTGTVTFFSRATQIGMPAAVTGGVDPFTQTAQAVAALTTSQLPLGQDSITAKYNGDTNYSASTSSPITVSVTIPTTTTVSSSNPTIQQGSSVTFTAMVVPNQSGGPALTGTVHFAANSVTFGGPVTLTNGQAQITTNSLPAGTLTVTAGYSGDNDYGISTASVTETVNPPPDFTFSANSSTVNVASPGSQGTVMLMITGQNGYNGTVNFTPASCAGLPSQSSCSFSPASVTGTGTTTLTISTTAPSIIVPNPSNRNSSLNWWMASGAALAFVFLLGADRRRRHWRMLFGVLGSAFLVMWIGCGGGAGGTTNQVPVVSLSPSTLTFGNQLVGSTSAAQTVTLTNTGNALLSITSIVASGDYAQSNTCGSSVAAGASCMINVKLTPTASGSRTGAIAITDNASGSPQSLSVAGTGITNPGTPTGTFPVTVTATSGGLNHTATFTLNVQ